MVGWRYGIYLLVLNLISHSTIKEKYHTVYLHTHVLLSVCHFELYLANWELVKCEFDNNYSLNYSECLT